MLQIVNLSDSFPGTLARLAQRYQGAQLLKKFIYVNYL